MRYLNYLFLIPMISLPNISLAAPPVEICFNGIDDNADGLIDEAGSGRKKTTTGGVYVYADSDLDYYLQGSSRTFVCSEASYPLGYYENTSYHPIGDCDDSNAAIYPGALGETCDDGVDTDCDGRENRISGNTDATLVAGAVYWYQDRDSDGYGNSIVEYTKYLCPSESMSGYVTNNSDCKDNDASINPDAAEICDDIDNDCDGTTDEGFDADADGYSSCIQDCNDSNAAIHPKAREICNDIDDDCDGIVDDIKVAGAPDAACADSDGDGYGVQSDMIGICDDENIDKENDEGDSYVDNCWDCNDADASVGVGTCSHESGEECANGLDDDADGNIDASDRDCGFPIPTSEWDELESITGNSWGH